MAGQTAGSHKAGDVSVRRLGFWVTGLTNPSPIGSVYARHIGVILRYEDPVIRAGDHRFVLRLLS